MGSMKKTHQDILRHYTVTFDNEVEPLDLLPYLTDVLNKGNEEKIKAGTTRRERVDKLLDILPKRGDKAFNSFLKALEEVQPHLAECLRKDEEIGEERVSSANLREKLKQTEELLEKEKVKNSIIQKDYEYHQNFHKNQIEKLHEQMLKTEEGLKTYFESAFCNFGEALVKQLHAIEYDITPHLKLNQEAMVSGISCKSSLKESEASEQGFCHYELGQNTTASRNWMLAKEDENGNVLYETDKLKEIATALKREKEECDRLRKKLKLLESKQSSSQDRSTSPMDISPCQRCKILDQEYVKLQRESIRNKEETQRLKESTTKYQDQITALEKILSFERSACEKNKEDHKKKKEALQRLVKDKEEQLKTLNQDNKRLNKSIRSEQRKYNKLSRESEALNSQYQELLEEKQSLEKSTKVCRRETAESRENARVFQERCTQLTDELEKWKSLRGRVLNFYKAFDLNGVIYALSKMTERCSVNATRSSDGPGKATDILNHLNGIHSGTENKENSWWQIDLGPNVLLFPNHYALRHGSENGLSVIINWKLEGSRDGKKWKVLKQHSEQGWFRKGEHKGEYPFYKGSWPLGGAIDAVRYLRIYQTGKNSAGDHVLYLSGFEVYGVLLVV